MKRFGDLQVGQKFFLVDKVFETTAGAVVLPTNSTSATGKFYEKKSLSSAFVLTPGTLERTTDRQLFHKTFSGFSEAVEVYALQ